MANTYRTPDEEKEKRQETTPHKAVGVYEKPTHRGIYIAIVVILLILAVFLLYRYSRGEMAPIPGHGSVTQTHPAATAATERG